ncbi:hypothetical protein POKO110462_13335 [Pontibacter korlensis]
MFNLFLPNSDLAFTILFKDRDILKVKIVL